MNFLYSLPQLVNPGGPDDGELKSGLRIEDVTPGLLGFLATFFLVVMIVLLIRDMVKRIRRVRYREQALTGVGSDVFIPSTEDLAARDSAAGSSAAPAQAAGNDAAPAAPAPAPAGNDAGHPGTGR
ncbi:hypothetical protein OL239_15390 [Arthrobacter sp. ATA002]|uniref:hypothetical protein n=1 Tax=Arthrobacter sp. ATA002 TaxID=2991715 RepID=UPI0022A69CDA|nr:hypothetical protein [Arthrobacter sp. ATA002]WAP51231.1 hypothetical protein OL239_15390 [Arthrobacter sp. ATA002]